MCLKRGSLWFLSLVPYNINDCVKQALGVCVCVQSMEDWKRGNHQMGRVRPFEKDPPAPPDEVNIDSFGFKMVVVERVPGKRGWAQYRFSIPQKIRLLYMNDVLYGPEWRQYLADFDKKFLRLLTQNQNDTKYEVFMPNGQLTSKHFVSPRFDVNAAPPETSAVVPHTEDDVEVEESWSEPSTLEELMNQYVMEAKMAGKVSGTSVYVVPASRRDGSESEIVPSQKFKLFLAPG